MTVYPDTSFLCSIYRKQIHTPQALAYRRTISSPLPFTRLLEFEFIQAIRLQIFLHDADRAKGYSENEANQMIADWEEDIAAGLNVLVFKVVNETLDWQGSVRFADAAGQPVKGLGVTLTPP